MNSLDRRLQTLEESAGRKSSLDQSVNLTPDERAIVLRNYVRWIARLSLTNGVTLRRFIDAYGPNEPSPVSFEGMNPNCADNLNPFGLGPDDIWAEVSRSGISERNVKNVFLRRKIHTRRSLSGRAE